MTPQSEGPHETRTGTSHQRTANTPPPYLWKIALATLGAMLLTIPLGIGFFVYEGVFALLSDAGGLLVGILLGPLVWGLYRHFEGATGNRAVLAVGIVTVAGIVIGSGGLTLVYILSLDAAAFGLPFLAVQFLGWLLLGGWLLGIGLLGRGTGRISARTSWTAVIAGVGAAGGIATLVYSYAVGSFTLLFPLFMAVFVAGFLLWAFLLGRDLRSQAAPAGEASPLPADEVGS